MQPEDLKALRKGLGMTQEALAEAIGVSRKLMVEMEAGRAAIEKRTALAVRYLQISEGGTLKPVAMPPPTKVVEVEPMPKDAPRRIKGTVE